MFPLARTRLRGTPENDGGFGRQTEQPKTSLTIAIVVAYALPEEKFKRAKKTSVLAANFEENTSSCKYQNRAGLFSVNRGGKKKKY